MQIRNGDIVDGRYRIEQEFLVPGFPQDAAPVLLYNALDEQLERPVRLQFLSAAEARDPSRLQRFVRNGQLAASLHHPNVAGVYDAGEWNGWPYCVMARLSNSPAAGVYEGTGSTPNVGLALSATRQAAEALQAVRDAGMSDWTFSHQALSVSSTGDTCLYPIMGLEHLQGTDAGFTSSAAESDARALSGLLSLMLVGTSDPKAAGTPMPGVPSHVLTLMDRMYLDEAPGKLLSAGAVAASIAELESSALQPTQAYEPAQAQQPASEVAIATPYYGPADTAPAVPAIIAAAPVVPASSPDAPTMAAPVPLPQDTRVTSPMQARPYVPTAEPVTPQTKRRPRLLPVLPLLVLLLLAGAVAILWPKTNTASGSVAVATPGMTPLAQTQRAVVPDVRGKTLEDANAAIGLVGLHLGQTEPVRDPNFAANTVARQVPDPGTPLEPGNVVSITLNLGPEPTPVPQTPAVQPTPQPQEPAAQPEPPDKKKEKDKDNDKKKKDR